MGTNTLERTDIETILAGRSEITLREFAEKVMGCSYDTAHERHRRGSLNVVVTQVRPPEGTKRGTALMVSASEVRHYAATHLSNDAASHDASVATLPVLPHGQQWQVIQTSGRLVIEAVPV